MKVIKALDASNGTLHCHHFMRATHAWSVEVDKGSSIVGEVRRGPCDTVSWCYPSIIAQAVVHCFID